MNFINHIPIGGHIKGGLHLLCGDEEEGIKSLKAANRASFVTGGAIVGSVFGPAGAAGGAAIGGTIMDTVHSCAGDRSEGVIRAGERVITDVEKGRVPIRSTLNVGVYLGADAISGLGANRVLPRTGGVRIHPM
ncbi:unnamed protein product [Diatraea saccharalis]|uniref:Uncharacterized protein n=1 Tax=Diatraea saccharalis TaxID=40085 RepID=A0A9N9R4Q2_9NEOP|nr:unnamed protein product [Diatraea saccharalis]